MDYTKYKNSDPYPKKPQLLSAQDRRTLVRLGHLKDIEKDDEKVEAFREARKAWNQKQAELRQQFKRDALDDVGLLHHPKAGKIYAKAWESGHSSGLSEVHSHLIDLSELFEDEGAHRSGLCQRLLRGRGGRFHSAAINSAFGKLTVREAQVLEETIKHLEDDARQEGRRAGAREPWKR